MTQSNHDKSRSLPAMACLDSERRPERLLIVGGDSVGAFIHRTNSIGRRLVRHWSGRKQRDVARSIPKQTDAVIVVLDRVSHALARKIRIEAARRGLPILYQKRAHVSGDVSAGPALLHAFRRR
jgi:hypothetical protein